MTLPTHALLDGDTLPAAMIGAVFPETFTDDAGVEVDRYPAARLQPLPADWYTRPMLWNGSAFVDDVAGERTRLIDMIKAVRETAIDAGCDTPLGRVQTDADSRAAINAAVSGALMAKMTGQPFTAMWTMADNSIVAHSADAMLAMGAAVLTCVGVTQAAYEAKRAALNAATTLAGLWAVASPGSAA